MTPTTYQTPEIRDSNDNIIKQGSFGKNTALANSTNDGWIDYVANDLEFLYGLAKDEVVPVAELPSTGDTNKTYLLTTTGVCYRWSGTEWVEISSSEAVSRADSAAYLAEQWATKTSGTVDGTEYSAKYYAEQAQDTADDLSESFEQIATNTANIEENAENIATNTGNIAQHTTDIDIAEKRIGNIEKLLQGNLYDYQTDSTSAYTKTVPQGAMPYASLEQIGGKTVVWNQLVDINSVFTNSSANVTHTKTDGVVDVKSANNNSGLKFVTAVKNEVLIQGHIYLGIADIKVDNASYGCNVRITKSNGGSALTGETLNTVTNTAQYETCYVRGTLNDTSVGYGIRIANTTPIGVGCVAKNIHLYDLTLLYGAGNEPTTVDEFTAQFPADYYAFNNGTLLSAGVTEVESVGKNLFNPSDIKVIDGLEYTDGVFANTKTDSKTFFAFMLRYYNDDTLIATVTSQNYNSTGTKSVTFTATVSCNRLKFYHSGTSRDLYFMFEANIVAGKTYTLSFDLLAYNPSVVSGLQFDKFQIEESATATAYSPYMNISYPIPAEIQALEGYGWSAGSAYNYVDFERKKFVKCVDRVVLDGTQSFISTNWRAAADGVGWIYSRSVAYTKPVSANVMPNIVCDNSYLPTKTYNTIYYNSVGIGVYMYDDRSIVIWQSDTTLTTSSAINTYMSSHPITVYYELETPVETDISAYLTDDNLISVESGGTLTFPNSNGDDYRIPVPSAETYMVDLQSAI